jgi:hypothetical protein
MCRGRLKLVVTDVIGRRQVYLQDFQEKKDLIDANMASIHIPFFLDFGPVSFYKSPSPPFPSLLSGLLSVQL